SPLPVIGRAIFCSKETLLPCFDRPWIRPVPFIHIPTRTTMAIFGKDYHIIGNLFTALYRDKYLIHVASCTDRVLRYLCFTFPLEAGKGPSLAIEDGRYWENEAGNEWRYVFRDGGLTYTLEFFEINENPPIVQVD